MGSAGKFIGSVRSKNLTKFMSQTDVRGNESAL